MNKYIYTYISSPDSRILKRKQIYSSNYLTAYIKARLDCYLQKYQYISLEVL